MVNSFSGVRLMRLATAAMVLAAGTLAGCAAGPAAVEDASAAPPPPLLPLRFGPGAEVARLANPRITESSGVAASTRSENVFWTHNDSGDGPRLYAFDGQGNDLGTVILDWPFALDWEDMASFRRERTSYLLVGDVGDNLHVRPGVLLLILEEPAPPGAGQTETLPVSYVSVAYSGGSFDCEAVGVDVQHREVLLVTKSRGSPGEGDAQVFAVQLPRRQLESTQTPRHVATLAGVTNVTGMDISPDNLSLVVCTYETGLLYTRRAEESWEVALGREPEVVALPQRRGGESICFGPDGRSLYLTTEGANPPFYRVPVAGAALEKSDQPGTQ